MTSPAWRVVAASVQGTAHQRQNLPCQDAHGYHLLSNGTLLVTVADGAGSAARSAEGAQHTAQQAIAVLASTLDAQTPVDEHEWCDVMREAFRCSRARLVELAAQDDAPLNLFATTLTCVVVTTESFVVGRVGDGMVIAETSDNTLVTCAPPQRGEYANETYFITQDDALAYLDVQVHAQPIRAIAATTDGLMRLALKLPDYTPHTPFFQPLFTFAAQAADEAQARTELAAFLSSERVCARTDDDKTLVVAVRIREGADPSEQ